MWVNVAFTSVFAPFDEIEPDEFRRVTEVSYLGYVYGTMAALQRMKPRDRGTIVQVGSALAYRGIPLQTAYCGAKHAIQGFHESLRCELLHEKSNVHVTMVQMPAVNTPQFSWVLSRLPRHAAAGAADLPAGGRRPRASCTPPTIPAAASTGSARSTAAPWSRTPSRPACSTATWPGPGSTSQQTNDAEPADQPANLWKPADGPTGSDFGAHGDFDDKSHQRSLAAVGQPAPRRGRRLQRRARCCGSRVVATKPAVTACPCEGDRERQRRRSWSTPR